MIEHGLFVLPVTPTMLITSTDRSVISCGCAIYVGLRSDTMEATTLAVVCPLEHEHLLTHANTLIRSSLADPSPRLMIDVVDELLAQAASAHQVPA